MIKFEGLDNRSMESLIPPKNSTFIFIELIQGHRNDSHESHTIK
jgi:hypothetical protein